MSYAPENIVYDFGFQECMSMISKNEAVYPLFICSTVLFLFRTMWNSSALWYPWGMQETMLLMLLVLINSANKTSATSQDISLCQNQEIK